MSSAGGSSAGGEERIRSTPEETGRKAPEVHFVRRVLTVLALVSLFVLGGLILVYGTQVFLLTFAGILFGVGLAGLADSLALRTGMRRGWALTLVIVLLIAALAGVLFGFGVQIAQEADELADRLPQSAMRIRGELQKQPILKRLFGGETGARKAVQRATEQVEQQGQVGAARTAGQALIQTASAAGSALLVFFLGLFFAATPDRYRMGVLHLVPKGRRARAKQVMDALDHALQRWWFATLMAMASAGVMTAAGLWLVGIPLALSLGMMAALGELIPNFGPVAAAVPAVMLGFIDGSGKALTVVVLYIVIQTVQSYVVTPLVQQRAVDLPAALQIVAIVLMAALFGPLGLLLATPLMVVIMVLVKMLYVQDVLGDPMEATPGTNDGKQE